MPEKYELPEVYKQQLKDQKTKIAQLEDLIKRLQIAGVDVTNEQIKLAQAKVKLQQMMDAFEVK